MFKPGRPPRRRRDVWFWLAGVAVLCALAVLFFGPTGGTRTGDMPSGGAPADTGPAAPIAGVPDAAD